jgi:hypothetical protein
VAHDRHPVVRSCDRPFYVSRNRASRVDLLQEPHRRRRDPRPRGDASLARWLTLITMFDLKDGPVLMFETQTRSYLALETGLTCPAFSGVVLK